MRDTLIGFFVILFVSLFIIVGALFGGLYLYKFFAPKYQKAYRDVWEQTPSRIIGAEQDIAHRYFEFQNTNSTKEKLTICHYLRQAYSDVNPDDLRDYELRQFFRSCKYGGW